MFVNDEAWSSTGKINIMHESGDFELPRLSNTTCRAALDWADEGICPYVFSGCAYVVRARVTRVFCSTSWALADPVAGLALAERFTDKTERSPAMRRRRGSM